MRAALLSGLLFLTQFTYAQFGGNSTATYPAREFSRDVLLNRAKAFVMNDILGKSNGTIRFELDPQTATKAGDLSALVYKCESQNKEGLLLGFFGDRQSNGVVSSAYGFKNLPKTKALELIDRIETTLDEQGRFIGRDPDDNNVYFAYEDVTFLIYNTGSTRRIRIFWNSFDAEWDLATLRRVETRFNRKANK